MSSHPGSTMKDAIELALYLKRSGYAPEQVQDFYPTPGTASTVMFYTGLDPFTMKRVYVATDYEEKKMQRALLQWNRKENHETIRIALRKAGRPDLIGYSDDCLVKPERSPMHSGPKVGNSFNKKANAPKGKSTANSAKPKKPHR